MARYTLLLFCLLSNLLLCAKSTKEDELTPLALSLRSLYKSLDPLSITEHLAFYELYPDSKEGKFALKRAWELLSAGTIPAENVKTLLPKFDIQAIISLITRQSFDAPVKLNSDQLSLIEKVAERLSNRKLPGHKIWTKEEVLQLQPHEIDLSRGLLIFQFDDQASIRDEIRNYEASIDLMALQIAARLSPTSTSEEKIRAINHFIFQEMGFRFPPHSLYAKDIDLYTFLPSVLDNRQGVCLGVSILYLSLAQRLDLPLEIITPPGHIYVRYNSGTKLINIETTARGIHMPSEMYLGINTRRLQQRNIKEVIGMAFFNQASVYWTKEDYKTAVTLYEKALPFLPEDSLLKMLLGLNYLFLGKKSDGIRLLKEIQTLTFDEAVSPESIPDDYLSGRVDIEGLKAIFLPVDEKRESILKKQQELHAIVKKYPLFRAGLLHLATTYLQTGRGSEAREILEKHHKLDPNNATIEYYLSILCLERLDFNRAWDYVNKAEQLTTAREHHPKALTALREHLRRTCPEPL